MVNERTNKGKPERPPPPQVEKSANVEGLLIDISPENAPVTRENRNISVTPVRSLIDEPIDVPQEEEGIKRCTKLKNFLCNYWFFTDTWDPPPYNNPPSYTNTSVFDPFDTSNINFQTLSGEEKVNPTNEFSYATQNSYSHSSTSQENTYMNHSTYNENKYSKLAKEFMNLSVASSDSLNLDIQNTSSPKLSNLSNSLYKTDNKFTNSFTDYGKETNTHSLVNEYGNFYNKVPYDTPLDEKLSSKSKLNCDNQLGTHKIYNDIPSSLINIDNLESHKQQKIKNSNQVNNTEATKEVNSYYSFNTQNGSFVSNYTNHYTPVNYDTCSSVCNSREYSEVYESNYSLPENLYCTVPDNLLRPHRPAPPSPLVLIGQPQSMQQIQRKLQQNQVDNLDKIVF